MIFGILSYVFCGLISLIVGIVVAFLMRGAAKLKGYDSSYHIWAISFWLSLPGWIYVLALPDLSQHKQNEKIIQLLSKE